MPQIAAFDASREPEVYLSGLHASLNKREQLRLWAFDMLTLRHSEVIEEIEQIHEYPYQ